MKPLTGRGVVSEDTPFRLFFQLGKEVDEGEHPLNGSWSVRV